MNDRASVKKGQHFHILGDSIDLLGITEKTKQKVSLPISILGNAGKYEALDDEQNGSVLVMKRKVIQLDDGKRVLADVYIQSSYITLI